MIIGTFDYSAKENTYHGNLATLVVQHRGVFFRPTEKSGDKEPDYRVVIDTDCGPFELGAAWKRTSERGQEFLSVSLDDPSFSAPINCAMFMNEGGNDATLVWNRSKPKPANTATATTAKARKAKAA
jgi:uncharacterized protein (DUF736 family)